MPWSRSTMSPHAPASHAMTASNALRGKTIVRPETSPARSSRRPMSSVTTPTLRRRQLSSGRTHVIGLTVADFDLIFPAALAAAISDRPRTLGYQVIVQQTRFSHDFERRMLSAPPARSATARSSAGQFRLRRDGDLRPRPPAGAAGRFGLEGRCDCVFTPLRRRHGGGDAASDRAWLPQEVLMLGGSYLPPERFAEARHLRTAPHPGCGRRTTVERPAVPRRRRLPLRLDA